MCLDPGGTLRLFVRRVRCGEEGKLHRVAVSKGFKQRQGPVTEAGRGDAPRALEIGQRIGASWERIGAGGELKRTREGE